MGNDKLADELELLSKDIDGSRFDYAVAANLQTILAALRTEPAPDVVEAAARHWLDLQSVHPIQWEGGLDEAMRAACDEIRRLAASQPAPDVAALVEELGPYTLSVLRTDDYSGEHREWREDVTIPKGNKLIATIVTEALTRLGGRT